MKKIALLFGMSENERRGFLVLSVLIVLIGIAPFFYGFYANSTVDDRLQLSAIVKEEPQIVEPKAKETAFPGETEKKHTLFSFDPNNLPVEKWVALGFSEKQAQVIKNYEAKGGSFRTKADLAKLYVVSEEDFDRLSPYITLPETVPVPPKKLAASTAPAYKTEKVKEALPMPLVDLAGADTLTLKEIRGIGSVLASRIVKFRDALGGFHSLEQVKEVYGITEEQFLAMKPRLALEGSFIQKLPVNSLSAEALAKHPYISRREAAHIIRYREQHGAFGSLADMEKMYALDEDFLLKIAPYLEFN